MLEIKNISKTYKTGSLVQRALDNVSLNLRDNEFVAILGPSGSGKTTLLNIIGGLDRYDSGDLVINGKSTSKYRDRDWDTYRNHTIGFVFQSYNLIPHQTVLANVELALTISGISKRQRKKRALQALDEVGLLDQAHKKPNQMSGGQMQRVAIARALVNNPDILLADEPTGALDTKTSIQVMNLLKEVAKDRLVVMVTHNPELAHDYANRIVELRDGEIVTDSNPYHPTTVIVSNKKKYNRKARMGYFTALALSFNNLLTKKGRTILTAFAGSIGIIGIALILSLSQGFSNYIDKIQEDTLSSYPLTITSDTADMTSAILSMVTDHKENNVEGNQVIERQYLSTMFSSIGTNDLKSLKKYMENNEDEFKDTVSKIKYSYSISPQIYTIDAVDNLVKLYPSSLWNTLYSSSATSLMSSFSSSNGGMIFAEMSDDMDSIYDQYDVLAGRWPSEFNEMIIVLSEPNSISDLLVYSLGLRDVDELKTIITSIMAQDETEINNKPLIFSYDDLLNIKLKLVQATDTYKYNSKYDIYEDMSEDNDYMMNVYNSSLDLKIVGIVCPKDPDSTIALTPGVNFSSALTQYVIDEAKKSEIVQKQLRNKSVDVFSGERFDETKKNSESELNFEDMITIDEDILKEAFEVNIDTNKLNFNDLEKVSDLLDAATSTIYLKMNDPKTTQDAITTLGSICMGVANASIEAYESNAVVNNNLMLPSLPMPTGPAIPFPGIITANITGTSLKEAIKKINPALSAIFTDSDYTNLAVTSVYMVNAYYADIINNAIEATPGTKMIAYKNESGLKTYGDVTPAITSLTQVQKMMACLSNPTTLQALNQVLPNYIQNAVIKAQIGTVIAPLSDALMDIKDVFGNSEDMMKIDTDKFASAFKFDLSQDELSRLMTTMMSGASEKSQKSNLISLGYQDVDDPTSISFYFQDFDAKEKFMNFLESYNEKLDKEDKISYTDITGILMSSVKKIVDSVTYVLIAFVSISLVVSSIMIAVITLISVMERTKEIGILRAMGASKKNVSSIFNAETFIIGLLSGLLGVGFTFSVIPGINRLIHSLTDNYDINAVLPYKYAAILVFISVILTILAGIIPSRKASKQDPVIALRTE